MVADYYEVGVEAIKSLIKDHRDELTSDGLKVLSSIEFKDLARSFEDKGMFGFSSKTRGLTLIPRRAILRIGMLLRDSQVARTVRTYLLNVEEEARAEAPHIVERAVQHISWREVYSSVNYKKRLGKLIGLSDGTATLLALSHTEREFGISLGKYKRHIRDDDLDETFSPTELGKRMLPPVSAQRMNRLLGEAGLQQWDEAAGVGIDGHRQAVCEAVTRRGVPSGQERVDDEVRDSLEVGGVAGADEAMNAHWNTVKRAFENAVFEDVGKAAKKIPRGIWEMCGAVRPVWWIDLSPIGTTSFDWTARNAGAYHPLSIYF